MVDERTAYWGARDDARFRTRDDDPTGGDFVVAETLDANGNPVDVLLRYDDTASEWVFGGPVNMEGADLTNVGSLDAGSVSTEQADYTNAESIKGSTTDIKTILGPGDYRVLTRVRYTENVGTTSTTIAGQKDSNPSEITVLGGILDDNGDVEYFIDKILTTGFNATLEVIGTVERGSPAGRSYSISGSRLELAMGSGEYNVNAIIHSMGVPL